MLEAAPRSSYKAAPDNMTGKRFLTCHTARHIAGQSKTGQKTSNKSDSKSEQISNKLDSESEQI